MILASEQLAIYIRLNPQRVTSLVDDLPQTYTSLSQDLEAFILFLEALPGGKG